MLVMWVLVEKCVTLSHMFVLLRANSPPELGRSHTNLAKLLLAKALLLNAEALLLPLKAICYILLLIKAKAFLLIAPQSSSWVKMMRILFCYCGIVGRNYTWVNKKSALGCIQLMRKEKRKTHCRIFSRNCDVMKIIRRDFWFYC
jgi:hypothetical protein